MGLSDCLQDSNWYVSIPACVWKGLSSTCGVGAQCLLGYQKAQFDAKVVGEKRLLQLNELEEFRLNSYESSRLYKEKTKRWHDKKILPKDFVVGQQVLLFNSKLKLFPGKLKSRWSGPFTVVQVLDRGVVELENDEGRKFKVNGLQLKHYWRGEIDRASVSLPLSDPY